MTEKKESYGPSPMQEPYEDEIDLAELLGVLIRRKWTIIFTMAVAVVAAVVFILVTPSQYEIKALVKPGVKGLRAQDLKFLLEQTAYEPVLYKKYSRDLPKVTISLGRQTSILILKTYHHNPNTGKSLLKDLLDIIDRKGRSIDVVAMKKAEIMVEKSSIERELDTLSEKKQKTDDIIERLKQLRKQLENKGGNGEALFNIEKEMAALETERDIEIPKQKKNLQAKLNEANYRLDILTSVKIIQPPYSSTTPVKPKKKLVLALALVGSFFLGIFLAFMKEFWENNKEKFAAD